MATRHLGFVILATLTSAATVACGSSDGSLFQGGVDAATTPEPIFDAGTLATDASDAAVADHPCDPVTASAVAPPWTPPKPFAAGACAAADMASFFQACLSPPIDLAACDTFKKANATCASCLESEDTDPTQGPVIWHEKHAYYTLNLAGCIANAEKDLTDKGCGAAYQAQVGCKANACAGCFPGGSSYTSFQACEAKASTPLCAPYGVTLHTACANALHDAGSPAVECLPPASTSIKDAYKQIAPLFCGK